jgi:hypothetical protein
MSARPESDVVPFDRVVVTEVSGSRTLSVEGFLALPLSQRIRLVLDRSVTFYNKDREVDRNLALDGLRKARISG